MLAGTTRRKSGPQVEGRRGGKSASGAIVVRIQPERAVAVFCAGLQ